MTSSETKIFVFAKIGNSLDNIGSSNILVKYWFSKQSRKNGLEKFLFRKQFCKNFSRKSGIFAKIYVFQYFFSGRPVLLFCPGWPGQTDLSGWAVLTDLLGWPVRPIRTDPSGLSCLSVTPTVMSQISCPSCHVLVALFSLSCPAGPILTVFSSYPVPIALRQHSCPRHFCPCCPVFFVMLSSSCPICFVPYALSKVFCPGCHIPSVVLAVLSWLSSRGWIKNWQHQ